MFCSSNSLNDKKIWKFPFKNLIVERNNFDIKPKYPFTMKTQSDP